MTRFSCRPSGETHAYTSPISAWGFATVAGESRWSEARTATAKAVEVTNAMSPYFKIGRGLSMQISFNRRRRMPTEMSEEVIEGSDLMPGWRIPAGSNPASVIELLNRTAELLLTKARGLAQKYRHHHDIPRSLAPWQARRITAHINANLETALRVEDLARIARLSESYFARAFCGSFGCPPHRFVTLCRLERAKELMLKPDVSLRQIATDCGFADQAHFSRIFLRFVGVSPARWRCALAPPPANMA